MPTNLWFFLIFFIFGFFSFSSSVEARPKHLEVWFVSEPTMPGQHDSSYWSNLNWLRCLPTYSSVCWLATATANEVDNNGTFRLPVSDTIKMNPIFCEEKSYFNFFCSPPVAAAPTHLSEKTQIWIDTSGSWGTVDPPFLGTCFRKKFIEKIITRCSEIKKNIYRFDSSWTKAVTLAEFCITKGNNNSKKLIQEIEKSVADSVLVIWDVYELTQEVYQDLMRLGALIKGQWMKRPLYANDLPGLAKEVKIACPTAVTTR